MFRTYLIAGLAVLALTAAPAFADSTTHKHASMHGMSMSKTPHPDQSADMLNAQQLSQIRGGAPAAAPAAAPAK